MEHMEIYCDICQERPGIQSVRVSYVWKLACKECRDKILNGNLIEEMMEKESRVGR